MARKVPFRLTARYAFRMGISEIWSGTTRSATTVMKRIRLPGNDIQAKPYAAKAAIRIGMTTAGIVTASVLRKALPRPSPPKITFW
jgi:hypothetical protein